jgi:hypothetical protein
VTDNETGVSQAQHRDDASWFDEESEGKPGTVASEKSLTEERDPSFHPQNAHEAARKISEESEGKGVAGAAKKMLEEVDRQVAGEYEHREEGSSARVGGTGNGTNHGDTADTSDPGVAGAQVAAEEERFDGLVNEPGNPPRQPGLQQSGEEDPVDE